MGLAHFDNYVLKIHRDNKGFVGYIKSYRKHRNGKYRFERTKNINKAIHYTSIIECNHVKVKLTINRDILIYDNWTLPAKVTLRKVEV